MTTEVARRGYPFAQVRPHRRTATAATPDRSASATWSRTARASTSSASTSAATPARATTSSAASSISARATPTTRSCIDRAERRLNNLGFFKKVRITNEPGTAPDRVSSTSTSRISPPARSRSPAAIRPRTASSARSRSRSRTSSAAASTSASPAPLGQRTRSGVDFSFTEPYFLGYRIAAGFDLFSKYSDQTPLLALREPASTAGSSASALPITEEFGVTLRYSLYKHRAQDPEHDQAAVQRLLASRSTGYHAGQLDGRDSATCGLSELRLQRRSLDRGQGSAGHDADLARRLDAHLQHARQLPEPAQRLLRRAEAGLRRPRRRLEVHPRRPAMPATTRRSIDDVVGIVRVQGGHISARSAAIAAHHRPVLPRTDAGPRLRALRHRPARRRIADPPRQRARRHDLFRRHRSRCSSRSRSCRAISA